MCPDRFLMNVSFTSPISDCLTFAVNQEEARKESTLWISRAAGLISVPDVVSLVISPLCFSSALSDLRQEEAFNAEF